MDTQQAQIVETRAMRGNWEQYTGHYRLIGVPGDYVELPGRGGRTTQDAAQRALAVFASGGTNEEASRAAMTPAAPKPGTVRGQCLAHAYHEETGGYLDRTRYDTPGSIAGCQCASCREVRARYTRETQR